MPSHSITFGLAGARKGVGTKGILSHSPFSPLIGDWRTGVGGWGRRQGDVSASTLLGTGPSGVWEMGGGGGSIVPLYVAPTPYPPPSIGPIARRRFLWMGAGGDSDRGARGHLASIWSCTRGWGLQGQALWAHFCFAAFSHKENLCAQSVSIFLQRILSKSDETLEKLIFMAETFDFGAIFCPKFISFFANLLIKPISSSELHANYFCVFIVLFWFP